MKKTNKQMLKLILLSYFGAMLGAYFKLNGNPNGDYILFTAIIFKIIGVFGLLYFNRNKLNEFLS
jgi:hypothetical protein